MTALDFTKPHPLAATRWSAVAPLLVRALVATAAVAALTLLGLAVSQGQSGRAVMAVAVAAGLGAVLSLSGFGFTHGYRQLFTEGRTAQVRAQVLLLGLVIVLFQPLLAAGELWGQPVRGFVFPIGAALVAGAFLFGVGMQIAGACGSGALFVLGGGSGRMAATLLGVVGGATLAAFGFGQWGEAPRIAPVSLPAALGLWGAIAAQLALLGAVWALLVVIERRRHGGAVSIFARRGAAKGGFRLSYAWGAISLAALCLAVLALLGRPWGIIQPFATWGSWSVEAVRLDDPHFWPFWEEPVRVELIDRPFLADTMAVMNVGVVLGAMLAAAVAGGFALKLRMSFAGFVSALVGGVLMGVGGIMATGCNISAFVSGVASGSLHGWVWIAAALPGNLVGLWLRRLALLDG